MDKYNRKIALARKARIEQFKKQIRQLPSYRVWEDSVEANHKMMQNILGDIKLAKGQTAEGVQILRGQEKPKPKKAKKRKAPDKPAFGQQARKLDL